MQSAKAAPERVWPSDDVDTILTRGATVWALGSSLAVSPDSGRIWQRSELSESGLDWHCDIDCARADWQGHVWHAGLKDGVLDVRDVARIPFAGHGARGQVFHSCIRAER